MHRRRRLVTGHTYIVYGPLANGATTLMFEGIPTYPDSSRFWQVVDKHQVNIFYTAPTAIRALMRDGDGPVKRTSRQSLRLLGSVGEPINPEAWLWYHRVVGDTRCPVVDTWWQTETGGILISPLPGATALKPGSATLPLPGIVPVLVDAEGKPIEGAAEGNLCIAKPWPGMMRTVYRDHERFVQTYFSTFPGYYFTGDGARRDADGYYWITGRVDDVINVSGHRMGTAEVESALVAHPKVAEAAVVGYPHDLKGQGIYAYVTLIAGEEPTDALRKELIAWVRREIGAIASPDAIQWAPGLPKTRSGKIMRRILRKIAANETDQLGDTSTLADPGVVDELVENRVGLRELSRITMQLRNTPILDARYWVAIVIASMFGANMGDLFAHDLGLGHVEGLLPLAILFAVILTAERWSGIGTEAYYWLAIVTLRTAATNLGDLTTEDLKWSVPLVIAGLTALLVAVWWFDRQRRGAASAEETKRLSGIDLAYWAAMLVAGTLGTVLGDAVAHTIGLGTACFVTVAILAIILAVRIGTGMADRASYWVAIVAVRTAGTNLGDYCAGRRGFNIGLQADAALFGVVLIALLLLWPRKPTLLPQET